MIADGSPPQLHFGGLSRRLMSFSHLLPPFYWGSREFDAGQILCPQYCLLARLFKKGPVQNIVEVTTSLCVDLRSRLLLLLWHIFRRIMYGRVRKATSSLSSSCTCAVNTVTVRRGKWPSLPVTTQPENPPAAVARWPRISNFISWPQERPQER